jgi:hypothetical protein
MTGKMIGITLGWVSMGYRRCWEDCMDCCEDKSSMKSFYPASTHLPLPYSISSRRPHNPSPCSFQPAPCAS